MKKFDLVIVGSGSGLMVMEAALAKGLTCAVVEKDRIGGTCLNKGCIPSKMLVYPADFIRDMERSRKFGIISEKPVIDWEHISKRMWKQISFSHTLEESLGGLPNLTLFRGTGSFTGPKELKISYGDGRPDEVIQGDKFLIATGAKSQVPPAPGLEETGYLTSETFFGPGYPKAPWKSLVILGGGAIAMEFAHIFSAYGTKVTIVARGDRLLRKEDEEIAEFLRKQFVLSGVEVLTDSEILSVERVGNEKVLSIGNKKSGEKKNVACEEILVATGSVSTGPELDLAKAGVAVDKGGWIITNEYLETNRPDIWAIGDINGKYQLRHKANHEAQVLMHNLFSGKPFKKANYHATPLGIFTHPQIGRVGATEQELKDRGIAYKSAKNHYSEVIGGRSMGISDRDEDNGFVKVLVGLDKKILGVHVIGPQAAAMIQPFVHLMNLGEIDGDNPVTYEIIEDSMVIHPSLSELTAWVFEKIQI